jgi:hypothetical protein
MRRLESFTSGRGDASIRRGRHRRSPLGVEPLEPRNLLSLSVGANINLSKMPGNQSEGTITIDPSNPARLFVSSNLEFGNGLFAATSSDGGATWSSRVIANGSDGLPLACCDSRAAFDQFGNLFLTYVASSLTSAIVVMSTDGGQTFTTVLTDRHIDDQPNIATGPGDLPGSGSVWISGTESSSNAVTATGARVTGLGQVGTFLPSAVLPGSDGGDFGEIAVGPGGEVLVSYQSPSGDAGPSTIFINRNLGGLTGGFSRAFTVASTNVGGFTPIPAQLNRTIDAEGHVAWDRSGGPHNGRAYLVFTDRGSLSSDRTEIFLTFSDNNGRTWSTPVRVNDVGRNSKFLPAIAVDQSTGNVAITWYDCRNDLGDHGPGDTDGIPNDDAQYWGTISTDGGLTFQPNVQISAGTSNAADAQNQIDLGDYTSVDFANGNFFAVWADNSNSTGDNPDGTLHQLDLYTAQVTVLPGAAPSDGRGGTGGFRAVEVDVASASAVAALVRDLPPPGPSAGEAVQRPLVMTAVDGFWARLGREDGRSVSFEPVHDTLKAIPRAGDDLTDPGDGLLEWAFV